MEQKHVISCLVENHFGVLARISGLFSSRGFNIDSLTVGETDDPTMSRMTIVLIGDDRIMEQVMKQLNKLIDVVKVMDLSSKDFIDRELALVKVQITKETRMAVLQIAQIFEAKVVDINPVAATAEITGTTERINDFLAMMREFKILEVVRTGKIALGKDVSAHKESVEKAL